MAGHLARNQVHAGSIPAALTTFVGSPPGRSDALQATPDGFDSRALHTIGSVLLGEQSVSKADEQRSNRCRPATRTEGPRLPLRKGCPDAQPLVRVLEGAAEWPATGPENPGRGTEPERFDPSAFLFTVESPSGKAPSCNLGTKRFDSALDLQSSHRCPNG